MSEIHREEGLFVKIEFVYTRLKGQCFCQLNNLVLGKMCAECAQSFSVSTYFNLSHQTDKLCLQQRTHYTITLWVI